MITIFIGILIAFAIRYLPPSFLSKNVTIVFDTDNEIAFNQIIKIISNINPYQKIYYEENPFNISIIKLQIRSWDCKKLKASLSCCKNIEYIVEG